MGFEQICPVCQFENIPRERETCPQCDSDLTCFKLLDALGNSPVFPGSLSPPLPGKKRGISSLLPWGGFLIVFLCVVGCGVYQFFFTASTVQKVDTQLFKITRKVNENSEKIIKTVDYVIGQVDHLEKGIEKVLETTKGNEVKLTRMILEIALEREKQAKEKQASPEISNSPKILPCFSVYQANDKDTLWTIARKLYGAGFYYPVLLEHNPEIEVYNIGKKDTLRYLCDRTLVPPLYRTITAVKQKRLYWKYKVRLGDTRESVINRYCLNKKNCLVNEIFPVVESSFKPGMTIGIFLE